MTETAPVRRSWRRRIVQLVLLAAGCYVGVALVLLALEDRFLYRGDTAAQSWVAPPSELRVEDVELISGDGTRIHCWWTAPEGWTPERGALLYCHGNAGNLSHRGALLERWQRTLGIAVLIFDYPGYGKSGGRPSEAGCYAAAEAAYQYLTTTRGVAAENVLLYGGSLGGAVAIETATHHPYRLLITVAAFTSFPDMAQLKFPWLPVRWLVRNHFDNLSKIAQLHRPVFLAHGTADSLVPFSQGERLFAAAHAPKCFFPMPGLDHDESPGPDFDVAVRAFLAENP